MLSSYLSINTHATSKHGDYADAMLPDHLPEVNDSVRQRRLARYVPELFIPDFHLQFSNSIFYDNCADA